LWICKSCFCYQLNKSIPYYNTNSTICQVVKVNYQKIVTYWGVIIDILNYQSLKVVMIMSAQKNQSAMDKLNEKITKKAEELEQLKRQKRAKQMRAQKEARKEDTRRKIVIGGIVLKYFPELEKLHPQRNNAENDIEFSPLANFLSVLASDKNLVAELKAKAQEKAPHPPK